MALSKVTHPLTVARRLREEATIIGRVALLRDDDPEAQSRLLRQATNKDELAAYFEWFYDNIHKLPSPFYEQTVASWVDGPNSGVVLAETKEEC